MSENEQNDSYENVCTLTDGAADSRPDSSALVEFSLGFVEKNNFSRFFLDCAQCCEISGDYRVKAFNFKV